MTGLSRAQIVGGLLTVAAATTIVGALFVLGSPAEERARRLDERRVQDLTRIALDIDLYWTRHEALPASLDELHPEAGSGVRLADPVTNEAYEYRRVATDRYELCARFDRDSPQSAAAGNFWSHRSGRQCFRRQAKAIQ